MTVDGSKPSARRNRNDGDGSHRSGADGGAESPARRPDGNDRAAGTGEPGAGSTPANYEQARDELSAVVTALEEGGLSLDESLALWERGQGLAAACETFLAGARSRVESALAEPADPGDPAARE